MTNTEIFWKSFCFGAGLVSGGLSIVIIFVIIGGVFSGFTSPLNKNKEKKMIFKENVKNEE